MHLKNIVSKGQRKPNKIWLDQGSEFYNQSFKDFLIFIRILKNKIFKHMTTISKNVYIDVLNDTVSKYNNTVHRTIKMKPIDVTGDSYVEYNEDFNKKGPKFKVNDHVRISTKIFLLKDMFRIGRKKFLLLMKLKILYLGLILLVI